MHYAQLTNELCIGLMVVSEALLEFLACEEDAALYCAEGEVHLFGDLVVLVTGNVH